MTSNSVNPSVEEIFEKVASIASKTLEIDKNEIKMDSYLAIDLGADALDVVELTMTLEMEFGLVLPDEIFIPQGLETEDTDDEETLDEEDFDVEEDLDAEECFEDEEDIDEEYEDDFDISFTLTIADYVTYIYKALNGISDC